MAFFLCASRIHALLGLRAYSFSFGTRSLFPSVSLFFCFSLFPMRQMPLWRQTEKPLPCLCRQSPCPSRGATPCTPLPAANVPDLSTRRAGPTRHHLRRPPRVPLLVAARLPLPRTVRSPRVALSREQAVPVGWAHYPSARQCGGCLCFCGHPSGQSPVPGLRVVTMVVSEAGMWPGPLPPTGCHLLWPPPSMRPPPPRASPLVVRPPGPPSPVGARPRRAPLAAWRRVTTLHLPKVGTALRATTRPVPPS